jgi:hypothetical protein
MRRGFVMSWTKKGKWVILFSARRKSRAALTAAVAPFAVVHVPASHVGLRQAVMSSAHAVVAVLRESGRTKGNRTYVVQGPPVDFRSLQATCGRMNRLQAATSDARLPCGCIPDPWDCQPTPSCSLHHMFASCLHGDLGFEKYFLDFGEHFNAELTQSV